jgi:hypothetical protein
MIDSEIAAQVTSDDQAHLMLARWRSPTEFRGLVEVLLARTTSSELFNSPRKKYLLDAWTLAEFTRHIAVDRVRLQDRKVQWPDGYIEVDRVQKNVEVTIADMPGRRMGDEYRDLVKDVLQHDPVEDWIKRAEAIPGALDQAIRNKLAKRYSSRFVLVVYVNLGEYGIRQMEVEREIRRIKALYREHFEELHVLWKDKVL